MKLSEWQRIQFKKGVLKGGLIEKNEDESKELEKQAQFLRNLERIDKGKAAAQVAAQVATQSHIAPENPFKKTKSCGLPGIKKWYTGNLKKVNVRIPVFLYLRIKQGAESLGISMSELIRSILIGHYSKGKG